jgi:hypothetical protein
MRHPTSRFLISLECIIAVQISATHTRENVFLLGANFAPQRVNIPGDSLASLPCRHEDPELSPTLRTKMLWVLLNFIAVDRTYDIQELRFTLRS